MPTLEHPRLSKDNDLSKTDESAQTVLDMANALQDNANNMSDYFHDDFRWMANTGCGQKIGLDEFRRNWQLPFRAAFSERDYHEEARIAQGEWVSSFGYINARHTGEFMGIPPTGKPVKIKYTDFWKVKDGKIADNWVNVDFPHVLAQLGVDVFNGMGWEIYDEGIEIPPTPADDRVNILCQTVFVPHMLDHCPDHRK